MIITRTPLRLSFVGGGTDMPAFYDHHPGMVISTAIDKSLYIMVNPKFDGRYRVSYSLTENVDNASDIQHDIVREILKLFEIKGLEVVSVSDIPGEGSGLGSSSAFTVGLLRAMYAYCGWSSLPETLAEQAFVTERDGCKHTIGKQDAYAAAFGGFRSYVFDGREVHVEDLYLKSESLRVIESSVMLFWTGVRMEGESEVILADQSMNLQNHNLSAQAGIEMYSLAKRLSYDLRHGEISKVGRYVHAGWALKKNFSGKISNEGIDVLVKRALDAGAQGAKICGAGGGGFLLVMAEPASRRAVEIALGLRRVPVRIAAPGSSVIYAGE